MDLICCRHALLGERLHDFRVGAIPPRHKMGMTMELTNLCMQALEHFVHAGDAITAQLNHVLDTVQAAGPGPEGEKTTCEVCRCTF